MIYGARGAGTAAVGGDVEEVGGVNGGGGRLAHWDLEILWECDRLDSRGHCGLSPNGVGARMAKEGDVATCKTQGK